MVRRFCGLPSRIALAAFKTAARHGSVSRAAQGLNVTPGAVSRQIRALEEDLGRKLFTRGAKGIALTQDGEMVAAPLKDGFERFAATLQQVRQSGEAPKVSIGTTMAIMQPWLMPRLGAFWQAHQGILVDHIISERMQDTPRPDPDLRIRYGAGVWPGEVAARLMDDRILAVASPDFLRRHPVADLDALTAAPLLAVEGTDWVWTTWKGVLRDAGAPERRLTVRRFNSYVISLQAARDGQGVAYTRIVRPGSPQLYGQFMVTVDMKTGAPMGGTAEAAQMTYLMGVLARRYGLPWRTSGRMWDRNSTMPRRGTRPTC